MSQPPYGVPPQPGQQQPYPAAPPPQGYPAAPPPQGYPAAPPPQGYPAAPPPQGYPAAPPAGPGQPPAYLQGGAHAAGPAAGGYGPALPPPPPSKKRTIGLLMGLLTTLVLLGFVALVAIISLTN